jgi:membrane-associated phospholipid phosphatase
MAKHRTNIAALSCVSQRLWRLGLLGLMAAVSGACAAAEPEEGEVPAESTQALWFQRGDVVLDWNEHTIAALTTHNGYADPLQATRTLSMVHLAMHDAVNATSQRAFESSAFHGRDVLAHPAAAAAAAAHGVLLGLFPAQAESLAAQLDASLAAIPDSLFERRGVRLGERAASAQLASRADDGSDVVDPYTPGTEPGDYQFTLPGVIGAPGWERVTPFGLERPEQFRPGPQPALDSERYARDFEEVKQKGNLGPNTRTQEESKIAQFWYEFSDIGWNRAARNVVDEQQLGLLHAARFMALVNIALADSYIAGWDAKFHYDFWRPLTAIPAALTDGNDATMPDAGWSSFLFTPPVQDYPSTHSALGAAAAEVMTRYFGKRGKRLGFSMTSSSASEPNLEVRTFDTFAQAAAENAESRVLAGLHFRFSCEAGLTLGQRVGAYVFEHNLRPLH